MPNGILPSLFVLLKIWKLDCNIVVDFGQCSSFVLVVVDSHCYEGHIGVGRFIGVCSGRGWGRDWRGDFDGGG